MSAPGKVMVRAGRHDRRNTPVAFELDESVEIEGLKLDELHVLPCQRQGSRVTFIMPRLKPGRERTLEIAPRLPRGHSRLSRTELAERPGSLEVRIGGKAFGEYRHDPEYRRPYLWPLKGPGEANVTRRWPMEEDAESRGDSTDHPHHRGLWTAHGDVSGNDLWTDDPGCGRQVHKGFKELASGPVYAEFTALNEWVAGDGERLLDEERTVRICRLPDDVRLIDLTVRLMATIGPVTLGDTKEAGICAVRVACSMEGARTGLIESSSGGLTEAETYGRRAHWVDYSGKAGGRHAGIAIMDHPSNMRHPTAWFVRDYGLFAANPFLVGTEPQSACTIEAGREIIFRYRLVLHKGGAEEGRIAERHADWVFPPAAELIGWPQRAR